MQILFLIALGIIIFAVINYQNFSYKATYFRNKSKAESEDTDGHI